MLTPHFSCTQTSDFVELVLKVPFLKTQNVEIDVNEHEFKFYGSPYFLRLSFPGKVHEDGTEKASYDISSGLLTIRLPKVDQDQHFPDLDMLTTLLAAPPPPPVAISSSSSSSSLSSSNDLLMEESFSSSLPEGGSISSLLNIQNDTPDSSSSTPCTTNPTRPLIQVLEPPACSAETLNEQQHQKTINQDNNPDMHGGVMDENQHEESVGDEMIDWYAEQDVPTAESLMSKPYGFNNEYSGYTSQIHALAHEVLDVDVHALENSTPDERRLFYKMREEEHFDPEHYIGDYVYDEEIQILISFKPKFYKALKEMQKERKDVLLASSDSSPLSHEAGWLKFSEEEQRKMLSLKNKDYLISNPKLIYLGLIDILFAYCYNHRTTEGENTVESAWTVCKLSATLCCFENFKSITDVFSSALRRGLTYPLYRHADLLVKCLEDVAVLMKLGKRGCLKALLETRDLIEKDEIVYICSRIWLTDYCCWVQKCDDKVLFALASEINHLIKQLKDIDDVAGSVSLDFHPSSSDAAATIDDNTAHSTDLLSLEQTKITISSLSSWDLSALHTLSKSLQSDANDEIIDH